MLAVGSMVSTAEHVRDKLKEEGIQCTLANGRFIKPVDEDLVRILAQTHDLIVTLEENVLKGGFGLEVTAFVHKNYPHVKMLNIALPDAYVEHGNVSLLRESLGIDSDSVIRAIRKFYLCKKENDGWVERLRAWYEGAVGPAFGKPGTCFVTGESKGSDYVWNCVCKWAEGG